jgi:hypothetical protein
MVVFVMVRWRGIACVLMVQPDLIRVGCMMHLTHLAFMFARNADWLPHLIMRRIFTIVKPAKIEQTLVMWNFHMRVN